MVKFAVVFGTRPEAIKMAPVVLAMRRTQVGGTGDLYWTAPGDADQALEVFQIVPDYNLGS